MGIRYDKVVHVSTPMGKSFLHDEWCRALTDEQKELYDTLLEGSKIRGYEIDKMIIDELDKEKEVRELKKVTGLHVDEDGVPYPKFYANGIRKSMKKRVNISTNHVQLVKRKKVTDYMTIDGAGKPKHVVAPYREV